MARIRSIKPEFPQSETIGNLSRDARLLFIQLWTVVDDDGRARAASRMLASLLYPYDDDAPSLIEGWFAELERENCLVRYEVDGSRYLQLTNWLKHQKIDHKSDSKLPPPQPIGANPRESSRPLAPDMDRIGRDRIGKEDAVPPSAASNGQANGCETPDVQLYRRGKQVLGASSAGQITKLLKAKNGSVALATAAIEVASTKHNPGQYIGGILRNHGASGATDDWIT